MNTFRSTLCATFFVVATLTFVPAVRAQATRTWISGVGDDVNPCSRTAPCKTFAGAIAKTALGGEINTIDPGGYGVIVITKPITIDGSGSLSSILASGATGVTINIADQKEAGTVRLRGLSINGAGTGAQGILIIAASKVSIEDTVIDGFRTNGVTVRTGQVFIKNTTVRNNAGTGINVATGAQAALSNVSVVFNATGLAGDVRSYNDVVLYGNKSGDPPLPK